MSRFQIALIVALSSGFSAPAWAQGYGCCGSQVISSGCYGCFGCSGGWAMAGTTTLYGCNGTTYYGGSLAGYRMGCWGGMPVVNSGYSCMGCFGGMPVVSSGCYGSTPVVSSGCYGGSPVVVRSSIPSTPVTRVETESVPVVHQEPRTEPVKAAPKADPGSRVENLGPPDGTAQGPAAATIVVQLPAEARLTINNQPSQATSPTRTFVSPPLDRGRDYYYTLKAEMVRAGQPVTVTQRIAVRAGEERQVLLKFPTTSTQ